MPHLSFKVFLFISVSVIIVLSCKPTVSTNEKEPEEPEKSEDPSWLIPSDQVLDGGPGRDGIPSIDNPKFTNIDDVEYLNDGELVLGVYQDGVIKAYPNIILEYHEIVNDLVGEIPLALTYCPLTGTGIGWNRYVDGSVTEFGVSGLIYKNNLIPFDRESSSYWSQMLIQAVHGEQKEKKPDFIHVVEMKWGTWKKAFPNSKVLSRDTGFGETYSRHLYGSDYDTNNDAILFPIENEDNRLPRKQRIHGILAGSVEKAYSISKFPEQIGITHEAVGGQQIVVAGSSQLNLAVSFLRIVDGTTLTFSPVNNNLPIIMKDQEGTSWNVFGEAVSGPRTGARLTSTRSYNAYWFAWVDFFPRTQLNDFIK